MSIKRRKLLNIIILIFLFTSGCGYTEEENPLGAGVNTISNSFNISGVVAQFDSGSIVVQWNEPATSETDIDFVEVYCDHDSSTNNVSFGVKNFSISTTSPSTIYDFVVTAVAKDGSRKDSFETSVKTDGPLPKIIVSSADITSQNLVITWNDPTNPKFDYVELSWEIKDSLGTVTASGTENIAPGIEIYTKNGLSTYRTYTYTLICVDKNGYRSEPSSFNFSLKSSELKIHFIYTAEDLNAARGGVKTGWEIDHSYYIMNNIDLTSFLSGSSWIPIGDSAKTFSGTMDGNGFTIKGLFINNNLDDQGLFGVTNGILKNIHIRDCIITGKDYVGSLAGQIFNGTSVEISRCSATGSVISGGIFYTGGLIGRNHQGAKISECFTDVYVEGGVYVGGLIGYNNNKDVENCYAKGEVHGGQGVGGLFGGTGASSIINSYSTAFVTATNLQGGFVGYSSDVFGSCYYDTDTSGQTDTGKGEPRSTTAMKIQSTYDDNDGVDDWDFDNTWGIDSAVNGGYPYLLNNPPE